MAAARAAAAGTLSVCSMAGEIPLRSALERLTADELQPFANGGYVSGGVQQLLLSSLQQQGDQISATAGLFFDQIVAGCSCGDDPVVEPLFCEVLVTLHLRTGQLQLHR